MSRANLTKAKPAKRRSARRKATTRASSAGRKQTVKAKTRRKITSNKTTSARKQNQVRPKKTIKSATVITAPRKQLLDKIFFGLTVLLLNIGMAGFLWYISPLSPAHPSKAIAAILPDPPELNRPQELPAITGKPIKIILPSRSIDLPVVDGFYNSADASWTLSLDKAHYATPTVPVNNRRGNTLIYGHNRWEVFYKLVDLEPGATMKVITDNGYVFSYVYESMSDVKPNDVSLFSYDGPPIVTLQTCTGNWYEVRRLFLFSFFKVDKL